MKRATLIACAFVLVAIAVPVYSQVLHADGPLPSFEVATIRPTANYGGGPSGVLGQSAVITLPPRMKTRFLIGSAYGMPYVLGGRGPLVFGGPDWIDKDDYTVRVKIPDDIFAKMQMSAIDKLKEFRLMEQSLLAQRYNLKVHFEMREIPVYELVVAKGGLKLEKDNDDDTIQGRLMGGGGTASHIHLIAQHLTMAEICYQLFPYEDRIVIDKTGITGKFSFKMNIPTSGTMFDHGVPLPASTDDPTPSLSTAIQDFGLKLQPAKDPLEVVVIDHIERPSEN